MLLIDYWYFTMNKFKRIFLFFIVFLLAFSLTPVLYQDQSISGKPNSESAGVFAAVSDDDSVSVPNGGTVSASDDDSVSVSDDSSVSASNDSNVSAANSTTVSGDDAISGESDDSDDSNVKGNKSETKTEQSSSAKKANEIKIMLTGDLMCKGPNQDAAYDGSEFDFRYSLKYVKEIFKEADIVVGNLEGCISESYPLARDISFLQSKPYLNAPYEFLEALDYAGFDGVIMANNHNLDLGYTGIVETIDAVEKAGLKHTGLYKSEDSKHYFIIERKGVKIGFLSYATYFNEKERNLSKEERGFMLSEYSKSAAKADIAALKKAGADYIIAYNHCGDEYSQTPAKRQYTYAKQLYSLGVDYVVNSHPHVLQPVGTVKTGGKIYPTMFSLGNFTGCKLSDDKCLDSVIFELTLSIDKKGKVSLKKQDYTPVWLAPSWNNEEYILIPEGYADTATESLEKTAKSHFRAIRNIISKYDAPLGIDLTSTKGKNLLKKTYRRY